MVLKTFVSCSDDIELNSDNFFNFSTSITNSVFLLKYTQLNLLLVQMFLDEFYEGGEREFLELIYKNVKFAINFRLTFEFPAIGGVVPDSVYRTVKLLRYVSVADYVILACEIIFICFTVYYIIEELIELKKHKWAFFENNWNYTDIAVIVVRYLYKICLKCICLN